eukprot:2609052-Prymnesium_polylepis.1
MRPRISWSCSSTAIQRGAKHRVDGGEQVLHRALLPTRQPVGGAFSRGVFVSERRTAERAVVDCAFVALRTHVKAHEVGLGHRPARGGVPHESCQLLHVDGVRRELKPCRVRFEAAMEVLAPLREATHERGPLLREGERVGAACKEEEELQDAPRLASAGRGAQEDGLRLHAAKAAARTNAKKQWVQRTDVRDRARILERRRVLGPPVLAQVDHLSLAPLDPPKRDRSRAARQLRELGILLA